jgi:hypothetical protein
MPAWLLSGATIKGLDIRCLAAFLAEQATTSNTRKNTQVPHQYPHAPKAAAYCHGQPLPVSSVEDGMWSQLSWQPPFAFA